MTLQLPIKTSLQDGALDAPVSRGWLRVQRKRAVRDTVRKSALAVSCLLLAASVGWAVRPLFPSTLPAPAPAPKPVAVASPAQLDSLVQQLPKVHARTVALQRPVPIEGEARDEGRRPQAKIEGEARDEGRRPQAKIAAPAPKAEPVKPAVDGVAALLESVSQAYEAGDIGRAAALLEEIGENHTDDPRAAQALYVLGLIQLDRLNAPHAAESFTHALELAPVPELVAPLWQALERARAAQESR